jgi:transcriptional regulator with XRE-family HTH domain
MTGDKNFDLLREKLRSTPEGRAAVKRYRGLARLTMALAELRESLNMTQTHLAELPGVSQETISKFEHGGDPHLSTMSRYVDGLGGQLELKVRLPEGETLDLTPLLVLQAKERDAEQKPA